jgi:hypothetical protein
VSVWQTDVHDTYSFICLPFKTKEIKQVISNQKIEMRPEFYIGKLAVSM